MARPRKHLRPEDYAKILSLTSDGASHAQIARMLGINAETFRERLKDDPLAARAYAAGRSEEEGRLVTLLREKAEKGDSSAAMFLLKCRHNYNDRPGDGGGVTNAVQVTISLPGPLDPDSYRRLVEGTASTIPNKPPPRLVEAG